jgi:septum formation topological specificity factor MinE
MRPDHRLSPADLRARLGLFALERAVAERSSLAENAHYMADLRHEIAAVESAYVGAAVTEIATLRADLGAPLVG